MTAATSVWLGAVCTPGFHFVIVHLAKIQFKSTLGVGQKQQLIPEPETKEKAAELIAAR